MLTIDTSKQEHIIIMKSICKHGMDCQKSSLVLIDGGGMNFVISVQLS